MIQLEKQTNKKTKLINDNTLRRGISNENVAMLFSYRYRTRNYMLNDLTECFAVTGHATIPNRKSKTSTVVMQIWFFVLK